MDSALTQFNENLKRARDLGGLVSGLQSMTTNVMDFSDIWRTQIVLAVSSLDSFIHDIVRFGMILIAQGERSPTDTYSRFGIPLSAVGSAINGVEHDTWLGETVREKLSWQSFQDPDKLAEAIRLISVVKLWDEVGRELGMLPAELKIRVRLIVQRRNKIVHEADLDPANPGFRWPIDSSMATDSIDFIENLGRSIFNVAV
jgi:hypothetical protein